MEHSPECDTLHDCPEYGAFELTCFDSADNLLPEQKLRGQPEPVHQVEVRVVVEVAQNWGNLQRRACDQRQACAHPFAALQQEKEPAVEDAAEQNDDVDRCQRTDEWLQQRPERIPDHRERMVAIIGGEREHGEIVLVDVQAGRGERMTNPPEVPVVVEEVEARDFVPRLKQDAMQDEKRQSRVEEECHSIEANLRCLERWDCCAQKGLLLLKTAEGIPQLFAGG